jgi:signal transduction histidine kinase
MPARSEDSGSGKLLAAVRGLPQRTSLRLQLVAALLALVAVALTIISITSVIVFRDYLVTRADNQVRNLYHEYELVLQGSQGPQAPGQQYMRPGVAYIFGPFVAVLRPAGQQLSPTAGDNPSSTEPIPLPDVPTDRAWLTADAGKLVTVGGLSSQDKWRVIAAPVSFKSFSGTSTGTLIVGLDLGDISGSIATLTTIDAIVGGLVLLGLVVVGIAVVRASLRPLVEIEQTAKGIAAGDLTRRVPDRDPRTEVGRLGRSLNAMLAQIESAFAAQASSEVAARRSEERMRQFVADASHELRTPLTAIRGFAEYYRQRGGVAGPATEIAATETAAAETAGTATAAASPALTGQATDPATGPLTHADLDRIIRRVEQEAARMGVLVDDMLLLARLDQQRPLEFRTVDLLAIAADALHDARVIAPKRTITLTVGTSDAPLVLGDEVRLRQVVGNLMSNAMTHTPDGTAIEITIRSTMLGPGQEPAVGLDVADQGPGLSAGQIEHVFERFYRTDRARTRTAGGTGLGLAIVAALVTAHHGRVWVDSQPGFGATFGFELPLAPEARLAGPSRDDGDEPARADVTHLPEQAAR